MLTNKNRFRRSNKSKLPSSLQKTSSISSADEISVDSNAKRDAKNISEILISFKRIGCLLLVIKRLSNDEKQELERIPNLFSNAISAKAEHFTKNRSFVNSLIDKAKENKNNIENKYRGQMFERIRKFFLLFIEIRREFLSKLNEYLCKSNSKTKTQKVKEIQLSSVAVYQFIEKYNNLIEGIDKFLQPILEDIKKKREREFVSDKNAWNKRIDEINKKIDTLCSKALKSVTNLKILGLF